MIALRSAISGLACLGLTLAALESPTAWAETGRGCLLGEKGKGQAAPAESINECIDQLTRWDANADALGRVYGQFGGTALAADRDHVYRYYADTDEWIPFVGLEGNRFISAAPRSKTPSAKDAELTGALPKAPEAPAERKAEGVPAQTKTAPAAKAEGKAAAKTTPPAKKAEVTAPPLVAGAGEGAKPATAALPAKKTEAAKPPVAAGTAEGAGTVPESRNQGSPAGQDPKPAKAVTGASEPSAGQGAAAAGADSTGKPSSKKNTRKQAAPSLAKSQVKLPSGTLHGLTDPAKQVAPSVEGANSSQAGKEAERPQAPASTPVQVAGSGIEPAIAPALPEPASAQGAIAGGAPAPPSSEKAANSSAPNTEIATRSPETEYFPGSPMCEIRKGGFWERRFAESIGECAVILATAPSSYTVDGVKWGYWDGLFLVSTLDGVFGSENGESNWTRVSDRPKPGTTRPQK